MHLVVAAFVGEAEGRADDERLALVGLDPMTASPRTSSARPRPRAARAACAGSSRPMNRLTSRGRAAASVAPPAESASNPSTSGCRPSSSCTAARTAPVPRPWTIRTESSPASAASSRNARTASRASSARRPRRSSWSETSPRAAATTFTPLRRLAPGSAAVVRREARDTGIADPLSAHADHLGLVALDRGDRAADAEVRRLDRVARRERAGERQRAAERAQRLLGPRRANGCLAETAVAVAPPWLPPRPDALLQATGRADLLAQRGQLGAGVGELRRRPRPGPTRARARPRHARARSRRRAPAPAPRAASVSAAPRRARPRPPTAVAAAARSAASASASRSAMRSRSGATPGARVGDDGRVEAQALRGRERVRRPGPAEGDAVERLVRLGIERRRRVRHAVGGARPLLQLGVVRGHDRQPSLACKPRDERLRERRALDRVGAGDDLVQQDERPVGGRVEDRHERADVAGERREAHLDRLRVADVCEHASKTGSAAREAGGRSPA